MRLWSPQHPRNTLDPLGQPTNLTEGDIDNIGSVIEEAYAPSTRSTYGTGLWVFHLFCDMRNIGEHHRAPIDPTVLASFISSLTKIYGGSAIKNFVYGIRAWHIIHGVTWTTNNDQLQALLIAAKKLTPAESKKKEKEPWTLEYLSSICNGLIITDPKDAAILACITTAFWGTARLGEVTVPKLTAFDPSIHVKPSDVQHGITDRNGLEETILFLPWTKAARENGEKIFWAKQDGIVDPHSALANHLHINSPPMDGHLFAFKHQGGMRPLTKPILLTRINKIADLIGIPKIPGHGLRVGGTLEYLLRGVPFEVVKAKGRWKSDAFQGYLRLHGQVMAPYMQADPKAIEPFVRYTMPTVR